MNEIVYCKNCYVDVVLFGIVNVYDVMIGFECI